MGLPKVSLQDWCDMWDLEPEIYDCPKCYRPRIIDVPYMDQYSRGLQSKPCPHCKTNIIREKSKIVDSLGEEIACFFMKKIDI